MKRSTIWGLAITLVLGCWVGSASARLLTAADSLLVPYYEAQGNLATLIGVQHVGPQSPGVSIINVTVHDTDGGVAAGGYICLGENEFGYVVLQNATPPLDEDFGIYFSVARDAIDRTGFVGLAYAGTRNSCSDGTGATQATARTDAAEFAMVAWAVLQDVGSGFFATEVPVVQVGWEAGQTAATPATELVPYCRGSDNSTRYDIADAATKSCGTGDTDVTYTFIASGPYCYSNTAATRANVDATEATQAGLQINAARTGCDDEFTHTFVPANTILPEIPAAGPRADVSDADGCDAAGECPGLAFNASGTSETIGARFDVLSSNRSVSNVYLWLDTAPLDGRKTDFSVICEDGMTKMREITIDDHVTVINPAGMGCSGRGVVELTLPERSGPIADYCYNSTLTTHTVASAVAVALDDRNNRCKQYIFTPDIDPDPGTTTPGCYERGDSDRTPVTDAGVTRLNDASAVAGCNSFTYVKAVTADSPSGYIFSHIRQSGRHYRMNFPGYKK